MILASFFHTVVTTLLNTPASVYATFIAAILAGVASLNAARVSSKTAKEVATLAAQTAKESAKAAAETAREIKDTDYKHDFYKRVIAKRLSAWEKVEQLMAAIIALLHDDRDNKHFFKICANSEKFDAALDEMKIILAGPLFWMGRDFSEKFFELYDTLLLIRMESVIKTDKSDIYDIDKELLVMAGKRHFRAGATAVNEIMRVLSEQAPLIPDVDRFFRNVQYPSIALDMTSN